MSDDGRAVQASRPGRADRARNPGRTSRPGGTGNTGGTGSTLDALGTRGTRAPAPYTIRIHVPGHRSCLGAKRSLLLPLVAGGGLVIETIDVGVEFPTRTVQVRIEIIEEQAGSIDAFRRQEGVVAIKPGLLDGLDLIDRPRLITRLTGWARTAKPPVNTVTMWCYDSRLEDLLALLDPLGAGPPYTLKVEPPPPAPKP